MQFQADILEVPLKVPTCLETTALGAAYLAGLAVGFWTSLEQIKKIHTYRQSFTPDMAHEEVKRRYHGWLQAITATRIYKL